MASDSKRPASHQLAAGSAKRRLTRSTSSSSTPTELPESSDSPSLEPLPQLGGRRVTRSITRMLDARGIDPVELEEPSAPWTRLPVEIQRMILKALAEIVPERPYFRRHFIANKYQSLSRHISSRDDLWMLRKTKTHANDVKTRSILATVSRQWQLFFEELNFNHLILHQDDLAKFEAITQSHAQLHRRQFIQGIYLRLELSEYGCGRCWMEVFKEEEEVDSRISKTAVASLFATLSSWDPTACYGGGLTLEISAHSPSDANCYARELYPRIADNTHSSFRYKPSHWYRGQVFSDMSYNPSRHGWWQGSRNYNGMTFGRRMVMTQRVFSYSYEYAYSWLDDLPAVPCVRNFLIRRQFYRNLGYMALRKIITSLSELVSFRYESWSAVSSETDQIQAWDFSRLLSEVITHHPTLRRISLYGSTNPAYHFDWNMYDLNTQMPLGVVKGNILEQSKELAVATMAKVNGMEEVHAGRNICAEGFFWDYRPCNLMVLDFTADAAQFQFLGDDNDRYPFDDGDDQEAEVAADDAVKDEADLEEADLNPPDPGAPRFCAWPKLTHLSLSTTLLTKDNNHLNWLLTAAARAAENMPKLKMMELWNYDPNNRAIFRYASNQDGIESGVPQIELYTSWSASTLNSHWHYNSNTNREPEKTKLISSATKNAWKEAVRVHVDHALTATKSTSEQRKELLAMEEYVWDHSQDWGASVINHLKMKERILTPISLEQLEQEGWEAFT
ncbi:hypothetical protein V8F33_003813 [Rhypophila sp. PSN 637]